MNAEKLFDIPVTDYSNFLRVLSDFEGMVQIYKLYISQKVARETWSKTLWVNLNPQALIDGIENFMKEFRKLAKPVRQLPISEALELKMKQFKNVVPLMVNLKSEALRERHWSMLMLKTGKEFNLAPERFTLDNMFKMELHKHQSIAEEIILNANKELAIERNVKDIEMIWATVNFGVLKYLKKDVERG